ncbi:hypothetical protein LZ30DRAFT_782664 [Colletotrichum cereale]|nr:hypothetical protein LZ30DRAFT_782664 [Colletotrichum cereale]
MREKKSSAIVNLASTAIVSGVLAEIEYTSSKHGLIGATKSVAWRFRREGTLCNAVLLGAVYSRIVRAIAAGHRGEYDAEAYEQELGSIHFMRIYDKYQAYVPGHRCYVT